MVFDIDNDILRSKFKFLIEECNSFTKYDEIKNNILNSTQLSSTLKRKRYKLKGRTEFSDMFYNHILI